MRTKGRKILLDQKSQDWLDWRNYGVGASESAIIRMEENYPYSSNIQKLWAVKTGVLEPEIISNKFTERGNLLEPVARELFNRRTGIHVEPMCFEHHYYDFIKASLDGITADEKIICEIKCPSKPERHQKALNGEIPEEYYCQIQHQFLVTGAELGYFVSYFPNYEAESFLNSGSNYGSSDDSQSISNKNDFKIIPVKPNYAYIEELQRKLVRFWKYVEDRILPVENAFSEEGGFVGKVGLVMLSGYAKSGKDELGKAFTRIYKADRYAFADPLKEVYLSVAKLTPEELSANKEEHRAGLVALGAGMRAIYPDVWLRGVFNEKSGLYESMSNYGAYLSDVRYVNEHAFGIMEAKRLGLPNKLIWIDSSLRGINPANEEEAQTTSLLADTADIIIRNDLVIDSGALLEAAMDMVVLKIYQGQKKIKVSDIYYGIKDENKKLAPKKSRKVK